MVEVSMGENAVDSASSGRQVLDRRLLNTHSAREVLLAVE